MNGYSGWLLVLGCWWLVAETERSVGLGDGTLELRPPHQRFVPYSPTTNYQLPTTNLILLAVVGLNLAAADRGAGCGRSPSAPRSRSGR